MEEEVVSALNIYDLMVRLVPGMVALMPFVLYLVNGGGIGNLGSHAGLLFLCSVVASYATGVLLCMPALFLLRLAHKFAYGGEPRDVFVDEPELLPAKKLPVLKDPGSRELAKKCIEEIKGSIPGVNITPRFFFGYMVNHIELKHAAAKEDNVFCLSETCASLAASFILVGLECLFFQTNGSLNSEWAMPLLLVCCFVFSPCCIWLAIRYERMRFSIVVRTYDALCRSTR